MLQESYVVFSMDNTSHYEEGCSISPPPLRPGQRAVFRILVVLRLIFQSLEIWPKNKSLDPPHFRFAREVLLHHIEQGDAARFLEIIQSNAFNSQFQFTEQEIGLDRLKQAALQHIGAEPIPWYFSYRVRIGIK